MTRTPSPLDDINKANGTTANRKSPRKPPKSFSDRQEQQWNLKTKAIALVVAVSMLPVLAVGVASFLDNQLIQNPQLSPEVQEGELALQRRQLSLLLISTGVTGLLAGGSATFLVNQSIRRILNATATSTTVVNKLRREESSTRARMAGKDELVALETNLKLIEEQLPDLLWKQELAAERSQVLLNISHRIWGARSEEDVLRTAVEEIRQAFKTDRVTVFRFNADWDGTFVEESVAPNFPKALWSTINDPCFTKGYVEKYRQGRVRAIDNIYQAGLNDCHIGLLERFAVKANIIAPIIRNDQLYGLLIAHQCSSPRVWQQPESNLFAQLAAQIGFALDHAKLLEKVDSKADQLQVFIDITRRIRESLNEDDILQAAVEESRKALRTERVIVFGFDADWYGTVLAESVVPGFPKALRANIKDPCFAEGYVSKYQAGRVQAINNIYEAGLTDCHLRQLEPFAVRANLVAPILKDDKLFGLLIAHQCSKPRDWRKQEIDLFTQLAIQVGFAIDHARVLKQLDQAYETSENAFAEGREQTQTLQRQVSELLKEREKAIKTLASESSNQMDSIQAAYSQIQAVTDMARGMDATVQQVKLQRQQVSQEVQDGHEAIIRVLEGVVAIRQAIVEVAEQVNRLDQTTQALSGAMVLMDNIVSELNLQAMNVGIEVTRNSKGEPEPSSISGKVLVSTRQLKATIIETESLVAQIQEETQAVMQALEVGTKQATAGTELVNVTQQKLNRIAAVYTQIDSFVEEIAQAAVNQTQTSTTANRFILEVASMVNMTSKRFMAVVESFDKLAAVAQEFSVNPHKSDVS